MASVYNFTFDNLTGLNDDSCSISEREMQNQNFGNYNVQSYFLPNCGMSKPIAFATSQPNVFYNGSHMVGLGGCNVDSDSNLRIGSIQTNPKCRISLQERPFLTVPYLGRGSGNAVLESKLQQGDMVSNKKSVSTTSETSHIDYLHTPMLPSLEATITNPANLIEDSAAEGWIRGGLPSRELVRDKTN